MFRKGLLMVVLLLLAVGTAMAATVKPLAKEYCFFGRWDRQVADRALTVNSGSYILVRFTGAAVQAKFDISLNQAPIPTLAWRIDDGEWQEAEIAATLPLADGLSKGKHTLMLMARGMDERQSRWKAPLVASTTFLGLEFPKKGKLQKPLSSWLHPKLTMEFLGDSITEGVAVQPPKPGKSTKCWNTDGRMGFAGQTAMMLGASWRQVGFGATGLAHGGSGGAPGALDSFNFFHATCPRDNWQPDVVVINQGTNDGRMAADAYQPLYAKYLALIRAAYPKAKIAALRPFNGAQETAIRAAVAAAQAAGDQHIYYIDSTGWYPSGPLHPMADACTTIATRLSEAIKTQVLAK